MNTQLFQQIAQFLLKKHYGLELNDTRLSEPDYVAIVVGNSTRPFEYLNEHAEDCDLDRVDLDGPWGIPSQRPLTQRDELIALSQVNAVVLLSDQPTACPICAARTDFEVLEVGLESAESKEQHHRCLNCGYEFIADDEAASPGELNDRYAGTIIKDSPEDYDALEIQGVRDFHAPNDPQGTCVEVDNEDPQFFSVYAHLVAGGVECVGDFGSHALADAYAKDLAMQYSWPIHDYVNEKFKQS